MYCDYRNHDFTSMEAMRRDLVLAHVGHLVAQDPTLEEVAVHENHPDLSPLRHLPKLRLLSTRVVGTFIDLHPAQTAAEFWQEYDAKKAGNSK